jgi:hypothetical protein
MHVSSHDIEMCNFLVAGVSGREIMHHYAAESDMHDLLRLYRSEKRSTAMSCFSGSGDSSILRCSSIVVLRA